VKRLYQKFYLTIVASLLLVVLVAGAIWRMGADRGPIAPAFEMAGELAAAALPPADAPREAQQKAVERLASRLKIDLALFDAQLAPIASSGSSRPPPPHNIGWVYGPFGPAWNIPLPDQRWIVARVPERHKNPVIDLVLFLGAIALVIAVCAYPVVRGLTRRLERLQLGVETLGRGNLSARVKVEGRDEVAQLASSFNQAATRIEELVGAHRLLLANTSHELKTPLSRLRLGVELYQKNPNETLKCEIARDIGELDALIDELLLASRLDTAPALQREPVDLLGLVAEACARYDDCTMSGRPVAVDGDARLLRRLVNNLLENARRHGKPPVEVEVFAESNRAILTVTDAGDGVPAAERERVFAPFYSFGKGRGTGLGLSLVRRIAELHGGRAIIAPRKDRAACFRIELPECT
jgi:signal transduction histidine kinase